MTSEELASDDQRRKADSDVADKARLEKEKSGKRFEKVRASWYSAMVRIGKRYSEATLDNFVASDPRQQAVIKTLRSLSSRLLEHSDRGHGLVFLGPIGTGKDHLGVAMLLQAAKNHMMTVDWCDGQELFQEFRDRISDHKREEEKIRELTEPDILLMSDPVPASGAITDFQSSILYRVIDRRYRNLKPTWVTLNVANREDAEKRLGAQVVDRLSHGAVNIVCNWQSYRKSAATPASNAMGNKTF